MSGVTETSRAGGATDGGHRNGFPLGIGQTNDLGACGRTENAINDEPMPGLQLANSRFRARAPQTIGCATVEPCGLQQFLVLFQRF